MFLQLIVYYDTLVVVIIVLQLMCLQLNVTNKGIESFLHWQDCLIVGLVLSTTHDKEDILEGLGQKIRTIYNAQLLLPRFQVTSM